MYPSPFYLKLLGVALIIFSAKLWFIHHFGGPVPFWDEWTFARGVFLPWMNAHLTFSDLLAAHNEHRPVFTRLLNLGLFILNKQWDPFLGMIVNAALSTLTAIFLLVVTRNRLGQNVEDLLLFCVLLLWILPYGWELCHIGPAWFSNMDRYYFSVVSSYSGLYLSRTGLES